jgi:hypothetical protein
MKGRRSTPAPLTPVGGIVRHGAAIFDEAPHDPYEAKGKHAGPARCTECGVVYERGRWRRAEAPVDAREIVCPACLRVRDRLPAGTLTLEGAFVDGHRDELSRIARNVEAKEAGEHPLARIMELTQGPGRMTVTTTDIHLPQRIGEAVKRAHHGDLAIEYAKQEYSVRVNWRQA